MNKKIRWITETAVMLALLVALQAITKPMGQLVTGTFVNAVLAVTALVAGLSSGVTVAVISPVLAYLLGVAPAFLTVPVIMAGNTLFVMALYFVAGKDSKKIGRQALACLVAAVVKFAAMYAIVVWLICGLLAEQLMAAGVLQAPMLNLLPVTFSWPQLVTALVGGAVASLIVPALRKALRK